MAKSSKFKAAIGTFKAEVRQADAIPVQRMALELQSAIEKAEALAPGSDGARVEALDLASKFISAGYGRSKVEQYMGRKPSTLQRYFTVARAYVKSRPVPEGWATWRECWEAHSLRELTELVKTERSTPDMAALLHRGYARVVRAIRTTEYLYSEDQGEWYATNLREIIGHFIKSDEMRDDALSLGGKVTDEQTLKMLEARFDIPEDDEETNN